MMFGLQLNRDKMAAYGGDGWLIMGINHMLCSYEGITPLVESCKPEMVGKWMDVDR